MRNQCSQLPEPLVFHMRNGYVLRFRLCEAFHMRNGQLKDWHKKTPAVSGRCALDSAIRYRNDACMKICRCFLRHFTHLPIVPSRLSCWECQKSYAKISFISASKASACDSVHMPIVSLFPPHLKKSSLCLPPRNQLSACLSRRLWFFYPGQCRHRIPDVLLYRLR